MSVPVLYKVMVSPHSIQWHLCIIAEGRRIIQVIIGAFNHSMWRRRGVVEG